MSDEVRSAAELFPNSSCELLMRQSLLCLFISSFSTLAISLLYNFTIVKLFKIEYFVQDGTGYYDGDQFAKWLAYQYCNSVSIGAIDSYQAQPTSVQLILSCWCSTLILQLSIDCNR